MDFSSIHTWAFWVLTALAAYLGSYAKEKGKWRAAKEDSEQIRAELAKTTATLKEIETRIAGEQWDRQWRQDQKLKIYKQPLRAINDYLVWLADSTEARQFAANPGSAPHTMGKSPERIAEDFHNAYAVAPLLLSGGSLDPLERAKPAFSYHSSPFGDSDLADAGKKMGPLRSAHTELVSFARRDLGAG